MGKDVSSVYLTKGGAESPLTLTLEAKRGGGERARRRAHF